MGFVFCFSSNLPSVLLWVFFCKELSLCYSVRKIHKWFPIPYGEKSKLLRRVWTLLPPTLPYTTSLVFEQTAQLAWIRLFFYISIRSCIVPFAGTTLSFLLHQTNSYWYWGMTLKSYLMLLLWPAWTRYYQVCFPREHSKRFVCRNFVGSVFLEAIICGSTKVGRKQGRPEREAELCCSHNKGLWQCYGELLAGMTLQSCPEWRQGGWTFIPQCWHVTVCGLFQKWCDTRQSLGKS